MSLPLPSRRTLRARGRSSGGFANLPVRGALGTVATLAGLVFLLAGDLERREVATGYRAAARGATQKVKGLVDGWKQRFHDHPPMRLRRLSAAEEAR